QEEAKSETYKGAWSVSEQHFLERLLTKVPNGEKNRYKSLVQDIEGHGWPPHSTSHVRKYFEKLKPFG
ncbi:hypothetical protein EDB89DRAFT_1823602, partial [Lactarius sanguifluus]